jgi:hypothetical protein
LITVQALLLVLAFTVPDPGVAQSRIEYNHQQLFLNGSNIAWVNFARDLGPAAIDTVAFRTVFDSIHAHGGNALRFWLHTTGQYTPQFNAGGTVIGPGTNATADLKRILDMAWQRRIGLVLCLWSFDMMVISNGATVTNRSELMLTDTAYTHAYINNALIPMVNGVRGHPGIIAWEVFNEAEGMSNEFGWSTTYHVPMANIQTFVNLVAGAIHRTDSTARVTTGTWALTAGTDVNVVARRSDPQTQLRGMTAAQKQKMEDDFAAHYGFRVPAAEILAKFAAANYNYYRDDRLVAAGGDIQGTLDFYTDHYYTWENTPISPFHHPYTTWNLTKPLVIAEFFPEQNLDIPVSALYDTLFANGYAGALSWGWYSGASGHSQATLQANTMALTGELFSRYPEEIDPDPVAGRIYSFSGQPTQIDSGGVCVLDWKTARGTIATLNGGSVSIRGTTGVSPPTTTSYALIAKGSITDTARVTVSVYRSGQIISFTASSRSIGAGDPVILRWNTAHGSVTALNDSLVKQSDSLTVHPATTVTYRLTASGSVRDTVSIRITATPQDQLNRALAKSVVVSESSTTPAYANPAAMVDGDTATQWRSGTNDNEWLECYLGENFLIKRVIIRWGQNYATTYRLRLSTDNSTWNTVRTITGGTGGAETLDSINANGGFVTILLDTRVSTSSGFAIKEFEVYGLLNPLSADNTGRGSPDRFALSQNYPNPFNPSTTIGFALPAQSDVSVRIYTLLGQEVATLVNGRMDAGYHLISWNGNAASGIYLCRMEASPAGKGGEQFRHTIKLILLK